MGSTVDPPAGLVGMECGRVDRGNCVHVSVEQNLDGIVPNMEENAAVGAPLKAILFIWVVLVRTQ